MDSVVLDYHKPVSSPQYTYKMGSIYCEDCVDFLKEINSETVQTVFADPPYNIKKTSWDNIGSEDDYIDWCMSWVKECARILKPTGTLYICGFTENIAELKRPAMKYFRKLRWLIWYYDNKANMSNDWGRSHESILCFRKSDDFIFNVDDIRIPYNAHTLKYPNRSQNGKTSQFKSQNKNAIWTPNPLGAKPKDVINIPTTCNGMFERTKHPTQKPEELLRKLIAASTNDEDLVVDPFSGSGTTAVVASQLNRRFLVNDNVSEYNDMAAYRLDHIIQKTKKEWIEFDRRNAERRKSIR